MASRQPTHVVIIGAGWYGLAAAKTYLALKSSIDLTIVDADSTVGGVWSASRVYPGLLADSTPANFDYSDLPMDEELGIDKWADLPAEKVHEYLERYVDKFDLRRRCRLNTRVLGVERNEGVQGGWRVQVEEDCGPKGKKKEFIVCDKLIVAAGVNSIPNMPEEIDTSAYSGLFMHSKDVGIKHGILTSEAVQKVTVLGGNKSAIDVVYLCARAGKEVDWIISPHGYGPALLAEPRTAGGTSIFQYKLARASLITGPTILNASGFWYWFLHSGRSTFGTWLLKWFFATLTKEAMAIYRKDENTMKIAPDLEDIFWTPASPSIVHDTHFLDLVSEGKQIHVHRATITSLSSNSAHLSNKIVLPSDALVFATGWKTNHSSLFPSSLLSDLGLPMDPESESTELTRHWEKLDQESMSHLKKRFPMLANPPTEVVQYDKIHAKPATTTPFRLFRGIVPPALAARGDNSLVFLGLTLNISVPIHAEVSALWAIAYLENLPFSPRSLMLLSDKLEMEKDISIMSNMGWLRFRDRGMPYLDGAEVTQSFVDQLVTDLGLRYDRKVLVEEKKGLGLFGWRNLVVWWKEWFAPYVGEDYRGLVREYIERWHIEVDS